MSDVNSSTCYYYYHYYFSGSLKDGLLSRLSFLRGRGKKRENKTNILELMDDGIIKMGNSMGYKSGIINIENRTGNY